MYILCMYVCLFVRKCGVVEVIHRESVELLQCFLDDIGFVGSLLVHASGVGGSGFFIIGLGGGEMGLEVIPRFVCRLFHISFSDGVCKDACVTEDRFSYADKLRVSFRCAMGFRSCRMFVYLTENICDWLLMHVLMLQ